MLTNLFVHWSSIRIRAYAAFRSAKSCCDHRYHLPADYFLRSRGIMLSTCQLPLNTKWERGAAGVRGCCWVGVNDKAGKGVLYVLRAPVPQLLTVKFPAAWGTAVSFLGVGVGIHAGDYRSSSTTFRCSRLRPRRNGQAFFSPAYPLHPLDWHRARMRPASRFLR